MTNHALKIEKRGRREYWLTGLPAYRVDNEWFTDCGPYESRADAAASRESMEEVLMDATKGIT